MSDILWEEEANEVLAMPISLSEVEDKLVWYFTPNGTYSVKSGYELAFHMKCNGMLGKRGTGESSRREEEKQMWNELWSLPTPGKIKHFLWKCYHNILLVQEVLFKRGSREILCVQCVWKSLRQLFNCFLVANLHKLCGNRLH